MIQLKRLHLTSCLALGISLTACSERSPSASEVATLQLQNSPASLPLTLQAIGAVQQGVFATDGDVRLRTALRTDDEATARLCGVLVGRSRLSEALPFSWPVDSVLPQLAPKILNSADVYGLRVLVPGKDASYRFEGFTMDGGTRVSIRWPVRSDRSVPATASDPEIESVIIPAPASLDSLVLALRAPGASARAAWNGSQAAGADPAAARAVRLVRDVPFFPIGFSSPCRDAHFTLTVASGIEKTLRVLAKKDEHISATVSSPTGDIVVSVVGGGNEAAPARTASATAASDGYVTIRVRYTAASSTDPVQQTVMLHVTSDQR